MNSDHPFGVQKAVLVCPPLECWLDDS